MANTFLNTDLLSKLAAGHVRSNIVLPQVLPRGHEAEFNSANPKVGSTMRVRIPPTRTASEFTGTTSATDNTETKVDMTVISRPYDRMTLTQAQLQMEIEDFNDQVITPMVNGVIEAADTAIAKACSQATYNAVGTVSDPPDTLAELIAIRTELSNNKAPLGGRVAFWDPTAAGDILAIDNVIAANTRGDGGNAFRNADMGNFLGFSHYEMHNIYSHTAGTAASYLINDAAVSTGAKTVAIDTGSGTWLKGDLFTVAGDTQKYTLTQDGTTTLLTFEPGIQVAWADNAAVTRVASHVANIACHPSAFSLAVLPPPPLANMASSSAAIDGIGVRITIDSSVSSLGTDVVVDTAVGFAAPRPEFAVRVYG